MTEHANIHEALLAFQEEAPDLPRRGQAQYGSYVTLDDLIGGVRPLLNKHGILFRQHPCVTHHGSPGLRTVLTHAPSQTHVEEVMELVLQQETPQGQGSAITYGRRYALQAALGLACETDDDGNVATPPQSRPAARRQPARVGSASNGSNGGPPV